MDAEINTPQLNPEQGQPLPETSGGLIPSPEVAPQAPERRERPQPAEKAPAGPGMTLPPVQVPPALADPSLGQAGADVAAPLIADDVDVIEQEWVNRAKQIINDTRDDPYAQEEAVEALQIEYLKKRYGKDIKKLRD